MYLVLTKKQLSFSFIFISLLLFMPVFLTEPEPRAYIAIVIDDFGNHGEGTDALLALDIPITVAVIPGLEHSQSDATLAHQANKEVILHIPLEPNYGKASWLGPKGITTNLTDEEIEKRIRESLTEIRYAKGMNNHMGSKATADKRIMQIILSIAKENDLYFLDSLTTSDSVVQEIATSIDVPHFKRDIFLDNVKDQKAIERQLIRLGEIALEQGYAIGIGHVGPEGGTITVKAIASIYPQLEARGIKFVFLSELIEKRPE